MMGDANNKDDIRCHYDVLGVERDATAGEIKKAHRKLALKFHPDKNVTNDERESLAAEHQFRLVQQAYECLSDPVERKWYDEHRDAILKGWSASDNNNNGDIDILFDVVPYIYAGCYDGYGTDSKGFYAVYQSVFHRVYEGEMEGGGGSDSPNADDDELDDGGAGAGGAGVDFATPVDFGGPDSPWDDVSAFYRRWEGFASKLSFAWADQYDVKEAPNRRVRRAMEDENRKARRTARRSRNDDIAALVGFVKKRDPRVRERKKRVEEERAERERQQKREAARRKIDAREARKQWRRQAEEEMAAREEEDLLAGRVRLADLEDDYDYGGGKKKKKKGKKGKAKNKNGGGGGVKPEEEEQQNEREQKADDEGSSGEDDVRREAEEEGNASVDQADDSQAPASDGQSSDHSQQRVEEDDRGEHREMEEEESEESEEEEPDVWRCECCRKDFKSQGQMENHMKSKKHKEAFKKYQKKLEKLERELLNQMLDEEEGGDG